MPRNARALPGYHPRAEWWQCLAVRHEEASNHASFTHICTLQREHFSPHLCWCGLTFTASEGRWTQPYLPGI